MHRLEVVTVSGTHNVMKTTWHVESKCQGVELSCFLCQEVSHDMKSSYKGVNRLTFQWVNFSVSRAMTGSITSQEWGIGSQLRHVSESPCQGINMSASKHAAIDACSMSASWHVRQSTCQKVTCHFKVKTAACLRFFKAFLAPCTDKKKFKFFSYIRKLRVEQLQSHIWEIYEEMRKYFPIYEEAVSYIWLSNCILNFLILRKIWFSFLSVWCKKTSKEVT